jgi:hypothetical protein
VLQEEKDLIEEDNLEYRAEKTLWEQVDNYNIFPVFASARVFIPSSFETLLVQSFYVKLTPLICEKFVCGQLCQTFQQVDIPGAIIGRSFLDLYRVFLANNVMCMGLYREPVESQGALIPYVYVYCYTIVLPLFCLMSLSLSLSLSRSIAPCLHSLARHGV